MGTSLKSIKNNFSNSYKNAIVRMGELILRRSMRPWIQPDVIFHNCAAGREQEKLLHELHSFTEGVIKDRSESLNLNGNGKTLKREDSEEMFGKKRMAMLDVLLTAQAKENNIDAAGIREEVDTFMFEGHDTTSMALIYGMMSLANYPDLQQKVYNECFEVFGDSDHQANIQELQQLKYLELFIKETLRLYPSVPFISRELTEPLHLSKVIVPQGTTINVHIFDVHRDPKIYPDPERFDPDRFLPENSVGRHPYAYLPFSAGPRNCIGQKFAMLELKSVISSIVRNFTLSRITRPEDVVFYCDLVLRTKTPIKVKFGARVKNV